MMRIGEITIKPDTSAHAAVAENPFMLAAAAADGQGRGAGLIQAYATMALAYETREAGYVLDERLRSLEQLIREGQGW